MKKRDPKTGKFLRTKPDWESMFREAQKNCEFEKARADEYLADYKKALDWLLAHSMPWIKWMFKRRFVK